MAPTIRARRDDARYLAAALALKTLSSTAFLRAAYRWLGNRLGQRRHALVTVVEVSRGLWLCDVVRKTDLAKSGSFRALELGTGWTHFYGLFLALFFDVKLVLFDVQDNRQFYALKTRFAALLVLLEDRIEDPAARERMRRVEREIQKSQSFEDLYASLGITYLLDANGSLDRLPSQCFDLVFSLDVLEHIPREHLSTSLAATARVLRPGGVSAHQIGLDDHLNHYVAAAPSKQYIRYGNRAWKTFFENRLQYFNRAQMPEFGESFASAGMRLVDENFDLDPSLLNRVRPGKDFQQFDERTLQAVRASIVYEKAN